MMSWLSPPAARYMVLLPILALSVLWAMMSWQDRKLTMDEAHQNAERIAALVEQHVEKYVGAPDQMLQRVIERFGHGLEQGFSPQERVEAKALADSLPQVGALFLIGRDGNTVLNTVQERFEPTYLGDRDYFQGQLDGTDRLFVSELLVTRTGGQNLRFVVSRPVHGHDGAVLGIAAASILLEPFQEFFRSLDLTDQDIAVLWTASGRLVVRSSVSRQDVGKDFSHSKVLQRAFNGPPADSFVTEGIDGVERVFAYRKMPAYSLVAFAGLSVENVLAGWWRQTLSAGAISVVSALVVALAVYWLVRALEGQKQLATELRASLDERSVLFNELNHRVKNNLQMVASMVTLQQLRIQDSAARAGLQELTGRIQSMAALHELLYRQNEHSTVPMREYVAELCRGLEESYDCGAKGIGIAVESADFRLPVSTAIPSGLVVTEAVCNAIKHAFPEGRQGKVSVKLGVTDGIVLLQVSDNGVGVAGGATGKGIGMQLLKSLAQQLGGEAQWSHRNGTTFSVAFPVSGAPGD